MSTKQQLSYIRGMVEDLINEKTESSQVNFHNYLQSKAREMIIGEAADCDDEDEKKDEDEDEKKDKDEDEKKDEDNEEKVDEAFAQPSEGSMSKKTGKVGFKKGGKKTLKKHNNSAPGLDDDKVEKISFKRGGKQPAKVLEKTPKPMSFNDGRDLPLGTS